MESFRRGVSLYPGSGTVDGHVGDHLMFAPAYNVTDDDIRRMVEIAGHAYDEIVNQVFVK